METDTMGRVVTEAMIENLQDAWDARRGSIAPDAVRRIVVDNALVDTGATTLALPTRMIHQLGLSKTYDKPALSSLGKSTIGMYDAVRVTILGRSATVEVMEVPDEVPVLIGQVPLEMLDLVVDPRGKQLVGNPAHGGEHVLELY
jgi:clan AA aspartic protease